jgi:hypothetical protein
LKLQIVNPIREVEKKVNIKRQRFLKMEGEILTKELCSYCFGE